MKKSYVKLLYEDNRYQYKGSNDVKMDILGIFLATDVGCYSPWFHEWALDDNQTDTGANYTSLEKEKNYIVLSEDASVGRGPFYYFHKDEFVKLLEQWEQVCKKKPKEVIITMENETFNIEVKQ
jgi:hypothetical protein